ncbi:MAG: hypothetical protein E6860_01835 [Clostridium sp.]|uniref:hypothetical protein n=1 Tax=Clostridium sp. TaxID=1506 RepID=UPI0029027C0F|nr:hypothetical protein [Clostridium sp.]MDU1584266.1 hypothetical protein [Clostridium sp.]MDU1976960.1 hypothetical protein [Clostridium sp.]MDU1992527.1 hypothetical protein [Clostridium sp.]
METISVALIFTVLGGGIGYLTFIRGRDKDIKKDAKDQAEISVKLDMTLKGIADIQSDFKAQDKRIDDVNIAVIKVNESVKSAHHRIDGLEEKLKLKDGM